MIPQPSDKPYKAEWMEVVARRTRPLEAYALGGPGIAESVSGDLNVQWEFHYRDGAVVCFTDPEHVTELFRAEGITQISACFDQQLNPFVAYTQNDKAYVWMTNPTTGAREVREMVGGRSPYVQLDDKRGRTRQNSDVIISFIRGTQVIALAQRERYEVEHVMGATTATARITALSLNKGYRLQWRIKEY